MFSILLDDECLTGYELIATCIGKAFCTSVVWTIIVNLFRVHKHVNYCCGHSKAEVTYTADDLYNYVTSVTVPGVILTQHPMQIMSAASCFSATLMSGSN